MEVTYSLILLVSPTRILMFVCLNSAPPPGPSPQDWPAEAGARVPLHHGEHGGGEDRGAGRDETTARLHRHPAR